mmetsp:Transcript_52402/g.168926  ORF Transcript_52402/g.168926 Transcript_52402/m.168926 type:complete len:94 (-) Transcript_52402:301-582(-)
MLRQQNLKHNRMLHQHRNKVGQRRCCRVLVSMLLLVQYREVQIDQARFRDPRPRARHRCREVAMGSLWRSGATWATAGQSQPKPEGGAATSSP